MTAFDDFLDSQSASATPLAPGGLRLDDFYAVLSEHKYMFVPTRQLWPPASINACLPPIAVGDATVKANAWLDAHRAVQQVTWAPGEPTVIANRLIFEGGWIERPGCACFNTYRAPDPVTFARGEPSQATRWLEHIRRVYPDDADHIVKWLAHRVQRPEQKINHALVLGGMQGIGKDTILEPVRHAIGPWNMKEAAPAQLLDRFNAFVKSVILRVSEARDLGDVDRFAFYDHIKTLEAAPPDVLLCDEKNLRAYEVPNVCGVIITTNHLRDGIYLPADDRRHYVAWSSLTKDDFSANYWRELWQWYEREGNAHVAQYLDTLDLSDFDPKAPPPKTPAFWDIVDANRAPEDGELSDVLERLGRPDAVTLTQLVEACPEGDDFRLWLRERRNARMIPHRLESVGYAALRNPTTKDGRWKVAGKNQVAYARSDLSVKERHVAVQFMVENAR